MKSEREIRMHRDSLLEVLAANAQGILPSQGNGNAAFLRSHVGLLNWVLDESLRMNEAVKKMQTIAEEIRLERQESTREQTQ